MEQAILRVDFKNKKLIPNQQNNSDFYKNKHELCDGEVTIKKRLNKLVDDMELKPTPEQPANYSISQTKVDARSLKSCLMAYDLKQ